MNWVESAVAPPGVEADRGSGFECAISIYSSREAAPELLRAIEHAVAAAHRQRTIVDVIVNGNRSLADEARVWFAGGKVDARTVRLRLWFIRLGDKAGAWNSYVHEIAPAAAVYIFIDGYVRVERDALALLAGRLLTAAGALAATGLPTSGFSSASVARQLRTGGGLHGNLYAMKATALAELRRTNFRLPLGLYRGDSTLGAALSFGLNLFPREWRPQERIALEPLATWKAPTLRWWHPSDWRAHLRRRTRQRQGQLENAAVRHRFAVRQDPFHTLPTTAGTLVAEWAAQCPAEARALLRGWRDARAALDRLQCQAHGRSGESAPELLFDNHSDSR